LVTLDVRAATSKVRSAFNLDRCKALGPFSFAKCQFRRNRLTGPVFRTEHGRRALAGLKKRAHISALAEPTGNAASLTGGKWGSIGAWRRVRVGPPHGDADFDPFAVMPGTLCCRVHAVLHTGSNVRAAQRSI
jgi:hypothetical protein